MSYCESCRQRLIFLLSSYYTSASPLSQDKRHKGGAMIYGDGSQVILGDVNFILHSERMKQCILGLPSCMWPAIASSSSGQFEIVCCDFSQLKLCLHQRLRKNTAKKYSQKNPEIPDLSSHRISCHRNKTLCRSYGMWQNALRHIRDMDGVYFFLYFNFQVIFNL